MIQLKMKQLLISFAFIDWVPIVAIQRFYKSGHDVYVANKYFIVFFFLKKLIELCDFSAT